MFRIRTNPFNLLVTKPRPLKRAYTTGSQPWFPPVRVLGPALWSVAACSTIYLGCAAYEVYQDAQHAKERGTRWYRPKTAPTFEDLQNLRDRAAANDLNRLDISTTELSEFADIDLTKGTIAVTTATHLAYSLVPRIKYHFAHIPAGSPNYTLLTSVFGHTGLLHLGMNMYGVFWLMPSAARSRTLEGSSAHLAAFYASAGILSSLASTLTAIWPGGTAYTAGLGASGALFALLGVVGVSFPHVQLGGSISIGQAMACFALFDAIGIFVRYPFFSLGHSAHLAGLGVGVAYVKLHGGENIWRPGRRVAFKAMRTFGIV